MSQPTIRPASRAAAAFAGVTALALLVSGCGGNTQSGGSATAAATSTAPASSTAAAPGSSAAPAATDGALSVADAWVKATGGADPSMTAAFGVLTNSGDTPLTITSATTSASDRTELHEMAMDNGVMVMRPIAGGIVVPAHGSTTLEPGGLHVMIMDVTTPVQAGQDVTITLNADNGTSLKYTALAKEFAGAQESYSPSMDMSGMTGAPMSGSEMSGSEMSGMSGMPTTAASGG